MLRSDLHHVLRSLHRSRLFTVAAVGTVAICIGANTAVFSLANTILFKPLPYGDADRLALITASQPKANRGQIATSYSDFLDWQRFSQEFEVMAAVADRRVLLTSGGRPEAVSGAVVSTDVFATLGVDALHGRTLLPDDAGSETSAVVIGHGLWQRRFQGDLDVLGRTIQIDGKPFTVVGIMPPRFKFPEYAEIWLPLPASARSEPRDREWLVAVGRLRAGSTFDRAAAEMSSIAATLADRYPESNAGEGASVVPLRRFYVGDTGLASLVFLCATGLVLLIACVNLANLLLARGLGRQGELALRVALGASHLSIVRLLVLESLVLAGIGGALGLVLGRLGLSWLLAAIPIELPFWAVFDFDFRVYLFATALSLLTGLAIGLLPALRSSRPDLETMVKQSAVGRGAGSRRRLARVLVASEVAVALALLVAAGSLVRAFLSLQEIDPGFRTRGSLMAYLRPLEQNYAEPYEQRDLAQRVLASIAALPEVSDAGLARSLPLIRGGGSWQPYAVEGAPPPAVEEGGSTAVVAVVGTGYFDTLDIPLQGGRPPEGRGDGPPEVVVSESLARQQWGDTSTSPLGRRLKLARWDEEAAWCSVVGVAGDVRQVGDGGRVWPTIYIPFADRPASSFFVFVRTAGDAAPLAAAIRRSVWKVDPEIVVEEAKPLGLLVHESLWQPSLYSWLLGVLATIAVLLAVLGIYGVVAHSVAQRTREIGVRMALGAGVSDILRLILGQSVATVLAGLAVGLPLAVAIAQVLVFLVPGAAMMGFALPASLTVAFLLLALLATWVPTRRATAVDPTNSLRAE